MVERYKPLTPFATAFAAEYKGFMRANGITNLQVAAKLQRNDGYVSERVNGKRALDTEDVDALAMLVPGWTGKALMIELARRVQSAMLPSNVTQLPQRGADVRGLVDDAFTGALPPEPQDDVVDAEGNSIPSAREYALAASDDTDWQQRQEEENE